MAEAVKLKRQMTVMNGVTVICGLIIGSAIYIAPKGVLLRVPSVGFSIVLWIIGGVLSLLGALSFAELGTTFPSGGEKYHYLEQTYGKFVAFLYLWMYLFLFRPGANAAKCLIFGQYIVKPFYQDCEVPESAVILLGISMASVLTAVNCINVRWATRSQHFCTTVGISALSIVCVAGVVHIALGKTENFEDAFHLPHSDIGDMFIAAYSGIFAYGGWNALNFLVEELKDPYRNLPRAIIISMLLVTVLYVMVNVSYMGILGVDGVLQSEAVAVSFAQKAMKPIAWIMPIMIAINTAGSFNSGTLVGSRLSFVGARKGDLPDVLGLINIKFFTPIASLIFQLVLVIILMCTLELYTLFNNLAFMSTIFDVLNILGLLWFRYKKPDLKRPIKMPLIIPIIYLICMFALMIFPLVLKPKDTAMGCIMILCTGIPYYVIFVSWDKPKSYKAWVGRQTVLVQKLLYSAKEEMEVKK